MSNATGQLVTWIDCQCGHSACVPHIEGLAEDIKPRLRCSACGAKGHVEVRTGWKNDANAMEGSRLLGAQATGHVRAMMPGEVCIIGNGSGGYGRDLGVLYGSDGRDVREGLMERGLAKASKNADWCE